VDRAVELAAVIQQLRGELSEAMRAGQDEDLRFELGPVQLELTVSVERAVEPGGKVRFWVLELGAEGSRSNASTQRIQLTLEPRLASQPDRRPLISGQALPGER